MKREFVAGTVILWAGSACAQGIAAPNETAGALTEEQTIRQRTTHFGPHPAPPPIGKPKKPRTEKPAEKPSVATGPRPGRTIASRTFKSNEAPPLLESWARPYLQGSVGAADSTKWSSVSLGAYAGINFVATGQYLLGFRAGIENFRAGPAVAPADFWQASVVARVGYLAGQNLIPYIVFGPAFAASTSKSTVGVTVGAGVEYRIDRNWSIAAEIDYSRFGSPMNSFASYPSELNYGRIGASFLYHFPISPPQR
jgi:opacity protein-like surface antigen